MGEKIGVLLFLVSCLATLWSVVGVIRPRIVLWWAVPEKRTRGRALGFGLLTALILFFAAFAVSPGVKWWVWGLVGLGFVVLFLMFSTFCMTKKELESLAKEHEYAKKAGKTATVYSLTSNRKYEIRPFVAQCSCPDWEERRIDASGPFRVCKHLASHYALHQEELPDDLKRYTALIANFGYEGKGVPPQGDFFKYGTIRHMAYIMTGYADSLPWVNVYTDSSVERYGFNLETGRWAKGIEPPLVAGELAELALRKSKTLLA